MSSLSTIGLSESPSPMSSPPARMNGSWRSVRRTPCAAGTRGTVSSAPISMAPAPCSPSTGEYAPRTDLLARIYWLITSGHRTGFDAERARWVSTSLAEAERHELWDTADSSSDAAKTLWRLERMLNNDRDIRNVDFAAWDLVRAAMLTRCGFAMGWLTEDETWDTLAVLDRALREHYRSWTQVSESFRLARWYWSSRAARTSTSTTCTISTAHWFSSAQTVHGGSSTGR